jgi:hypothetical protein
MRLSIAIVYLIGAMVATEVIYANPAVLAAKLRTWLEKTVQRLEAGQTLKQNRHVIYNAIEHTDVVLRTLSESSERPVTRIPSGIGIDFPDLMVIDLLESIRLELSKWHDDSTQHVEYLLAAIRHVLRGDPKSARDEINKSMEVLDCNLTPDDRSRFEVLDENNQAQTSEKSPGRRTNLDIPGLYIAGTGTQAVAIRAWLKSKLELPQLVDGDEHSSLYNSFLECVAEIAQGLLNTLPDQYLPQGESKFIGRYPLEEADVIGGRISQIEPKIIPMQGRRNIPIIAFRVMKSVLAQIKYILLKDLDKAKSEIDNSKYIWPYTITDTDKYLYYTYMEQLYGLQPPRPQPKVD